MIEGDLGLMFGGAMLAFVGIALFGILLLYVYGSFCLMKIAKKTNTELAWLAWIPIANLFLLAMIADKEWWWALIVILGGIVPIIGIIASLGAFIYLSWLVCEKLNKPGWLSILMLIPIVNLVILGYLAFSD